MLHRKLNCIWQKEYQIRSKLTFNASGSDFSITSSMIAANILNPWQYPIDLFHLAYANNTRFSISWFASASTPQNKLHPVRCKSCNLVTNIFSKMILVKCKKFRVVNKYLFIFTLTIWRPSSSSSGLLHSLKQNFSAFFQSTPRVAKCFSDKVNHSWKNRRECYSQKYSQSV